MNEATPEQLLKERNFKQLRQMVTAMNAVDIARLLDDVSSEDSAAAFRLLPKNLAAEVFDYLDGRRQNRILESFVCPSSVIHK